MMTSVRKTLKALIVTAAAVGSATAASAAPFVHADSADTKTHGVQEERLTQSFADSANLVFGLSFHAAPRGGAKSQDEDNEERATHYKFAAAFPTMQPSHFSLELHCLALNIYHEARGEPDKGKRAVGHVVMNRVTDHRFPRSVCQVVRQGGERRRHRCQFSWWCDGRSDQPRNKSAWDASIEIAREIIAGQSADPTGGALWYHADYVSPYWRKAFKRGPKIGTHIFYQARTATSL
jgi:spore germination cell wall hydrolase CwlJ-like protein